MGQSPGFLGQSDTKKALPVENDQYVCVCDNEISKELQRKIYQFQHLKHFESVNTNLLIITVLCCECNTSKYSNVALSNEERVSSKHKSPLHLKPSSGWVLHESHFLQLLSALRRRF